MTGFSEQYERALRLATSAHREQNRKSSAVPYITHPYHVSLILLRHGFSEDVAIAGLLHDVVEDQGVSLTQIEAQFGEQVASIVSALSERKLDVAGRKRPWEVRKEEALAQMRQASVDVLAVKAADTLHNVRTTQLDVRDEGAVVWQRFARPPKSMLGNYRCVLQVVRERLELHALVSELAEAIDELARTAQEVS